MALSRVTGKKKRRESLCGGVYDEEEDEEPTRIRREARARARSSELTLVIYTSLIWTISSSSLLARVSPYCEERDDPSCGSNRRPRDRRTSACRRDILARLFGSPSSPGEALTWLVILLTGAPTLLYFTRARMKPASQLVRSALLFDSCCGV